MGYKLTDKAPKQGVQGTDKKRYFPGDKIPLDEKTFDMLDKKGWVEKVPGPNKGQNVHGEGGSFKDRKVEEEEEEAEVDMFDDDAEPTPAPKPAPASKPRPKTAAKK